MIRRRAAATDPATTGEIRVRAALPGEGSLLVRVAEEAGARCRTGPPGDVLVRVATVGGRVAGFSGLLVATATLDHLFVHEPFRDRGVGRMLAIDLADMAAFLGVGGIRVLAHPATERFWTRVGAIRTGTAAPADGFAWHRPSYVHARTA